MSAAKILDARITPRLKAAEHSLEICYGKTAARQAIREYLAAQREARQSVDHDHAAEAVAR
jgi:hypothetical protein